MINRHRPRRAWTLGVVYFAGCWLVAAATGALGTLGSGFWLGDADPRDTGFWLLTGATAIAAFVGYWIIWPLGTDTHGRPFRQAAVGFGVLHGVSEGLLYLSAWLVVFRRFGATATTVATTLVVIAVFNAMWRTWWWDVWVTPVHNIPAWNARKIVAVHIPVLLLALIHVTLYRSRTLFVGFETIALVGSAIYMRFPSPRDRTVIHEGDGTVHTTGGWEEPR